MKIDTPDFLVVGAGKSGTTSLHYYLDQHPKIFMPQEVKELAFWHLINSDYEKKPVFIRHPYLPVTIEDYLGHFKGVGPEQLRGEVTPAYLDLREEVLSNLEKYHKNPKGVKIFIIIREPLDKVWSHYKFINDFNLDPDKLSLEDTLKSEPSRSKDPSLFLDLHLISNTNYLPMVRYYQENFNDVEVLLYDDLKKDAQALMNGIFGTLGVGDFTVDTSKVHFKTPLLYEDRNPVLKRISKSPKVKKFLGKNFADKVHEMNQREMK